MSDIVSPKTSGRHSIVNLYHVTKQYAGRSALRDVTMEVAHGEFVFLVGSSGAGKSTLLRMVYMEEFPSEGQVTVAGFVSSRMRRHRIPKLRRKVGVIFQDFKLLEDRSVFENIAFPLYVTGAPQNFIRRTALDMLVRVGLHQKRNNKPRELSGGEQQRVAIARALVNSPHVLLADEPTGNLDPIVAREILKLLFRINAFGTAVIMATHDHEMVRVFGQRIIHLEQGQIISDEEAFDRWSLGSKDPALSSPNQPRILFEPGEKFSNPQSDTPVEERPTAMPFADDSRKESSETKPASPEGSTQGVTGVHE